MLPGHSITIMECSKHGRACCMWACDEPLVPRQYVPLEPTASTAPKLLHPLLQTIRGMCTDEAPYPQIDSSLSEAVDRAKKLEDELARAIETRENANTVSLRVEAENRRLRELCARAARHLRSLPAQSDYKDGLMAAELEQAAHCQAVRDNDSEETER